MDFTKRDYFVEMINKFATGFCMGHIGLQKSTIPGGRHPCGHGFGYSVILMLANPPVKKSQAWHPGSHGRGRREPYHSVR